MQGMKSTSYRGRTIAIMTFDDRRIQQFSSFAFRYAPTFLPMALSHGDGAEIPRLPATMKIGGLITSTLLTGLLVPAIYTWFAPNEITSQPGSRSTEA
jgi:cobalt-zinc-cadmium resistance protein CzcA